MAIVQFLLYLCLSLPLLYLWLQFAPGMLLFFPRQSNIVVCEPDPNGVSVGRKRVLTVLLS